MHPLTAWPSFCLAAMPATAISGSLWASFSRPPPLSSSTRRGVSMSWDRTASSSGVFRALAPGPVTSRRRRPFSS